MSVNGIGTTGYPAWQGARKTQQNTVRKNFAEQINNVASAKPHPKPGAQRVLLADVAVNQQPDFF